MPRSTALAFLLTVFPAAAVAEDISGHYLSVGDDPGGGHFSGTADIIMVEDNACRITWNDGSGGLCLVNGDTLSVAYLIHGKLGLGVYTIGADGTIAGRIVDDLHGGGLGKGGHIGAETLAPAD